MNTVFVLGNAGTDLSLVLPHLARPGETVVATSAARAPGGKGLNQAVVAARAGGHVRFCAAVGQDAEAGFVAAALAREPLAELRLLIKPAPTDRSIVMVAADGENSIVSLGACADLLTQAEAAAFAGQATGADILLLQGNLGAGATAAAAGASPARVILNAAPLRWPVPELLPQCAVVVVNRGEAASITGQPDPEAAALRLVALGCGAAVITLGGDGCVWAGAHGAGVMAAAAVVAVDTTGAGDAFCGVLAVRLAGGAALPEAIAAGQAAAVLSVTRAGAFAALPSAAELGDRGAASR
jgi:ribokinase